MDTKITSFEEAAASMEAAISFMQERGQIKPSYLYALTYVVKRARQCAELSKHFDVTPKHLQET